MSLNGSAEQAPKLAFTERFPTNMLAILSKKNDLEVDLSAEKIKRLNVAAVIIDEEGKILYCQRGEAKNSFPEFGICPVGK